ncbi:hypothetical protein DSECCO2_662420 [anaerobic digester metagenome]
MVDVWLNDQLLLDDFAFRTASPFIDAPAGVDFDVVIQPANSTDTTNALARFTYNLTDGGKYILVANGIVSSSGYSPSQAFDIYVFDQAREEASQSTNTDVLVFHGSTDAPVVDVIEVLAGAGTIVDNLGYGEFAGYLELPTANYQLNITDETGSTVVATFNAPLADLGLQGQALTLVASGFLDTAANSNGPEFGLFAVLPSGGDFVTLGNTTNVATNRLDITNLMTYPNPSNGSTHLTFSIQQASELKISVHSMNGQVVYQENTGVIPAGTHQQLLPLNQLPSGLYLVNLVAGNTNQTTKLQVIK